MSALFKKLNVGAHTTLHILNAPASFDAELAQLTDRSVHKAVVKGQSISFVIAFATTQAAVDAVSKTIANASAGDVVVWIAYPKGTSRKLKCDFNRDTGWQVLGSEGFETVRQVAIDEDWSALRFRRHQYVKKLTRSETLAISKEGKKRTRAR
jgi:hypothetical protein